MPSSAPNHPGLRISILLAAAIGLFLIGCSRQQGAADSGNPIEKPTVWYVDPEAGSDDASGDSSEQAWQSFKPLNERTLGPGDEVRVSAGTHTHSLCPQAAGTAEAPVVIRFLPGVHEFAVEDAVRRRYFISNSCGNPDHPMPIGLLMEHCRHLQIVGGGTEGASKTTLMMAGRMTHFINDQSESIRLSGLVFDLKRPTVSEFRVLASGDSWSDIQIAESSTHHFDNGEIRWTGDLGSGQALMQQAIPAEGRAWRKRIQHNPLDHASRIEPLGEDRYRLHFENHKPLILGHQFQFRNGLRDVVGAHNRRCRDITVADCTFHALAGMGIISQFSENLTFERVHVIPPAGTLRTCPAWADVFHFSGCRGQILLDGCRVSGTQDDPVNVHGTHLRIVESPAARELIVEFVHPQTYGFAAFEPGDEIAVIHSPTLREHANNPRRRVTGIEAISDTHWRLTLDGNIPRFEAGDVIDNLSWYPDVTIRHGHVDMVPTRGFLLTTRGKVLVEHNTFERCRMPAILIEGDANGWFESGPIRDMMIRANTFTGCDIRIHPRTQSGHDPVHENIRIEQNTFREGASIEAHHATELVISGNSSDGQPLPVNVDPQSTTVTVTTKPRLPDSAN